MSKHTPGPWKVVKPFDTALTKTISVVSPAGDSELGNWMVAEKIPHIEDSRLIAAAPRLLEALKAGIHDGRLQTFEDRERWRAEARAAIAEAGGEADAKD